MFDVELLQHMHELVGAPLLADFECEHGALPEDGRFPDGCHCWDRALTWRAAGPEYPGARE